ncbi:MFS monosaccharide transporter [Neofusicoccum parvum]|uniref:MFS monosaccharide transporter n=1 Tax=Neofusicoccum parvum TaxID=310453 RepID=A0ACB5S1R4_9PEZI|nr:MFS monosaccharide transporter [Neofusicoccum parvum]
MEKPDSDASKPAGTVEHHEEMKTAVHDVPDTFTALVEDVSYGPGGIRGIIASPFVFGAAFLASLGGFSFGYDQGVISIINVMPQFLDQYPELKGGGFWTGFMTGMLELGAFLGCFFMPWLADKISRKWALSVVVVIFCIGAIIQTAAPDYGTLVFGRFFGGIGVGTLALGAPLYISEIAPPHLRGALLVLESVSIVLGAVVSYWITYATRHMEGDIAFRLPFGLQMVCAIILGVGIHVFPYSPRWLALVGRESECLQSLSRLRRLPPTDWRVKTEFQAIITEVDFQKRMLERRHPNTTGFRLEIATWLDLFRSWKRVSIGAGVAFFQQFSGINGFIYYAPLLFRSLGQDDEMSLILSGMINIGQLVAVVLCFFIIDHVGRRPLAIWGAFGMATPYIVMSATVGAFSHDWPGHKAAGWATCALAYIYILAYGVSYSPLAWALPAEVFSNSTRAKGVALSTSVVWLCNFIIGVIVPIMIEDAGYGTYVFFAIMCVLAGVWAFFLVPETKGKTLEEMDDVFGDSTAREEKQVMAEVLRDNESRAAEVLVNEQVAKAQPPNNCRTRHYKCLSAGRGVRGLQADDGAQVTARCPIDFIAENGLDGDDSDEGDELEQSPLHAAVVPAADLSLDADLILDPALFDVSEPIQYFRVDIPQRARTNDTLANAILALSSRILQWKNGYSPHIADRYYQRCLEALIPALNDESLVMDETLLAATIFLRMLEEMDSHISGFDDGGHLSGTQAIISVATNTYGHIVPTGFRLAAYWTAFRQELWLALHKQQPVTMSVRRVCGFDDAHGFGPAPDWVWCQRAVAHCADVLDCIFGNDEAGKDAAAKRWKWLLEDNARWWSSLPKSFEPFFGRWEDASEDKFPDSAAGGLKKR